MEFLRQSSRVLRSARPYIPSDQSGDVECMMADLILGDVQAEITRINDDQEKKRQEAFDQTKTPDYSWLMDWRLKTKKILSYRESSDIELLCAKVKSDEWNTLISEWRQRVRFVNNRDEVIELFRTIVYEIVNSRYQRGFSIQNVDELELQPPETVLRAMMRPWTSQGSNDQTPSRVSAPQPAAAQPPSELSVFSLNGSGGATVPSASFTAYADV